MRTALWAVFLVVALQGIASASTALASTEVNLPVAVVSATDVPSSTDRNDADPIKAQPQLRADGDRKPTSRQPQVLSKNVQSPKPVQIYWFFGGR
jgi:hypothetical protein